MFWVMRYHVLQVMFFMNRCVIFPSSRLFDELHNLFPLSGTICDDNFDQAAAERVCTQLGIEYSEAKVVMEYGGGMGQILLKDVECTDAESGDILNCPHSEWGAIGNCRHYEDVGVLCLPPLVEGDMRLVPEGDNPYEGRLEMYINGEWGKS